MKFLIHVFLIALSTYLAELIFPWWVAAVCAFVVSALLPLSGFKSFLSGFLGVGLLWLVGALYFSIQTDFILTEKVADLMQMGSSGLLMAVTALVGAVAGGMGALSGIHLHRLLKDGSRRRTSRYHSD